ncbi:hypothetical protein PIB30_007769 [Stylosanthes scabra]|uniref:Uncharacterized protein n=1 Tax=Stylosanthes scabra TaxID=79078 RepID=A0ABU6Z4A7_9FABA|nr:hypothetical protein [Stylosanthes scabra]
MLSPHNLTNAAPDKKITNKKFYDRRDKRKIRTGKGEAWLEVSLVEDPQYGGELNSDVFSSATFCTFFKSIASDLTGPSSLDGVGSCMPLGDGDAGLRRRGARRRNKSNDKAVQRGWRQMTQAHTRTEDEGIIRELIIETSKQRKPQQIIIFQGSWQQVRGRKQRGWSSFSRI